MMNGEKKRIIQKVLKISAWVIGSVALLLGIGLTALVLFMTPERLTPIVENAANDYLKATVKMGRVELTAWKTFPDLTLDVEDLTIVSTSLNKLTASQRAILPDDADSLMEFKSFHIGVNVLKLLYGIVSLKDITLDGLRLNLVAYSPVVTNYDIFPPSTDDSPIELPTLYWDNMNLTNCRGISYLNALEQTKADVSLKNMSLCNEDGDKYRLKTSGSLAYTMAETPLVKNLPFDINGIFDWNSDHVMTMGLDGFKIKVLDVPVAMSAHFTMDDVSVVDRFTMDLGPVKFASVVPQLPQEYQDLFANIQSNINATLKAELTEPYDMAVTDFPSLKASLIIPDSYIQRLKYRLDNIAVNAKFTLDGKKPSASAVELERFILKGGGIDLMLKGVADNLFVDPHVKADIKGDANLGLLTEVFNLPVNFSVNGGLKAEATAEFKTSDLTQNTFQCIKANGKVDFANFSFRNPVDSMSVKFKHGTFTLGNNQTFSQGGKVISDLLHFCANINDLESNVCGMEINMPKGEFQAGCIGDPMAVMDTTKITPFGGSLKADRIEVTQPDGTTLKIKEIDTSAKLTRYSSQEQEPKIGFVMKLAKISYQDKINKANLRDGVFNLSASMKGSNNRNTARENRMKELRRQHPRMSNDSLLMLMGKVKTDHEGDLDMSVDNNFKALMKRWRISGDLTARKGKVFTPYFPLKNRINNVDVKFSLDSLIVHNLDYKVGHSTFNLKGSVHNMRTNLMGKSRRPLDIDMILKADTIDFNQIMKAMAVGANYAANSDGNVLAKVGGDDSDEAIDRLSESMTTSTDTVMSAFLIPRNIEATVAMRAKNILYGDLFMNHFNGDLLIHDRTVNLHELNAKTDVGSARFNALYVAPDKDNIKFSFDLGMEDIQVAKFLSMIPQIDSIMPLLRSVDGVINADLAAMVRLDSVMNVEIPTIKAAVKLAGTDLVFMDAETFNNVAKMLLFKDKNHNVIDRMSVELLIDNSQLKLFPFMFDVDRYKLGVLGYTNMDLDSRYHISVLKSPVPFKFGINIYGTPDKMHFRFGGAKYKSSQSMESTNIVDTTRINMRQQISSAFRRGAKAALNSNMKFGNIPDYTKSFKLNDTLTHEDSLQMIKAGLIEAPVELVAPKPVTVDTPSGKNKQKKDKKTNDKNIKKEETAWLPVRKWLYLS